MNNNKLILDVKIFQTIHNESHLIFNISSINRF